MLRLIYYQSLNYLKYLVPMMIFLIYFYYLNHYTGGILPVFIFLCFWTFLMVSGSISTSERYEEKHRGYQILSILPLTTRETVGSKFLLVLGSVFMTTGLLIYLLFRAKGPDVYVKPMIMGAVFWGVICLIYGGVMYIGIFKFGFTRITRSFMVAFLVVLVAMFYLLPEFIIPLIKAHVMAIINFADSFLWIPVAIAGVFLYFILYKIALKVKDSSEEV